VVENFIPLGQYRKYFIKTIGKDFEEKVDFYKWLYSHTGKPLKKVVENYYQIPDSKNGIKSIGDIIEDMDQLLHDDRFNLVSKENKNFISEFTKQMKLFGYDFGGQIGSGIIYGHYMINYSQSGVKTKKVFARLYIRDKDVCLLQNGVEIKFDIGIVLKLFFNNIDNHIEYVQNAPLYIKEPFVNEHGKCNHCNSKEDCNMRKKYTIDGNYFTKCACSAFEFHNPRSENVNDYMNILEEFDNRKPVKIRMGNNS
jgi:hypothetical protein